MGNKKVDEVLKNFYGHRLQQDDSRTSRLYLNTSRNKGNPILLAKGYSSSNSVSISHQYNGKSGEPNDPTQHVHNFLKGATKYLQERYAYIQNLVTQGRAIRDNLLPDNTLLNKTIDLGTDISNEIYERIKPFISIFEARSASYEESNGYTDTNFNISPNLTIVLYPRLVEEEDLAIQRYNQSEIKSIHYDKMISPAGQLRTLLRFLTGRTEYVDINLNTTSEQLANKPANSESTVKLYVSNPITFGKSGVSVESNTNATADRTNSDIVRYRRILPPNGYAPKTSSYEYGIEGTFRLLSGGINNDLGVNKTNDKTDNIKDIYGSATRSSTGCKFYDDLLITNVGITNSETTLNMISWDIDSESYIEELTPEYITLSIDFMHAYEKYDFNELYWALGLSTLEDMKSLSDKNQNLVTSNEYDPKDGEKYGDAAKDALSKEAESEAESQE